MFADENRRLSVVVELVRKENIEYSASIQNAFFDFNGLSDNIRTASVCLADLSGCRKIGDGLVAFEDKIFLANENIGIHSQLSDQDGNFSNTLTIELQFPATVLNAYTIYADSRYGSLKQYSIRCYFGDTLIEEQTITNEFAVWTESSFIPETAYTKMIFEFQKTRPYDYIAIQEIGLGIGVAWDGRHVARVNFTSQIMPNGYGSFAIDQLEVTIRNQGREYGDINLPSWMDNTMYLNVSIASDTEKIQLKNLKVIEIKGRAGKDIKIVARDIRSQLNKVVYATSSGNTISALLDTLATYFDIPIHYPSRFSTISIMPYMQKKGLKTLEEIAIATGTVMLVEDGEIYFEEIAQSSASFNPTNLIDYNYEFSNTYLVNSVEVGIANFTIGTEELVASEQVAFEAAGEKEIEIAFKNCTTDINIVVNDGTLIESNIGNWGVKCKISKSSAGVATVEAYGRKVQTDYEYVKHSDAESIELYGKKEFQIQSTYVQSTAQAEQLASLLLEKFASTAKVKNLKWFVETPDRMLNKSISGAYTGVVASEQITLQTGLSGKLVVVGE